MTWVLALAGLVAAGPSPASSSPPVGAAQAADEVRRADHEFCRAAVERDLERFKGFIAPRAVFYGAANLHGPEEVARGWAAFFDPDTKRTIVWEPETVEASASGDLAVSRGEYRVTAVEAGGTAVERYGHYVSVWRRHSDGAWKVILDIGTPPAERPETPASGGPGGGEDSGAAESREPSP